MRKSMLPQGGTNLFQEIKKKTAEAEKQGKKIWKLTIGQPSGPALELARFYAAEAVQSKEESMHEYQDNGSPGVPGFAEKFVALHHQKNLLPVPGRFAYLPIPGIKPMLGLIPMACGCISKIGDVDMPRNGAAVATMTSPGYPTPKVQCDYLGVGNYALDINPKNRFIFDTEKILSGSTILLMLNYPHNPTGQVATKQDWRRICDYCKRNGIRLFNDAAYAILSHSEEAATLASVAHEFSDLSWCEAYSASKVIGNGTGWRIGAMAGSSDFIGDIATIKGNTDSGFAAPLAFGVLKCMEEDMDSIAHTRMVYKQRIHILNAILTNCGMQIAIKPSAGFFTLWQTPKQAFGVDIADAEQFNYLMIEKTGVAGVHFGSYIRYAVTQSIEEPLWADAISEAFAEAKVKY